MTNFNDNQVAQINRALYNGNHKKQAGIPQGLHTMQDLQTRYADKVPSGIPDNASAVFIAYNNIVAYIADKVLYINDQAQAHLTQVQALAVQYLTAQAGNKVQHCSIEWQGRSGGADMHTTLAGKVAGLFN